jgi:poly [ADP-ribose] polymerase
VSPTSRGFFLSFTFCLSGKFDNTRESYTKLIQAAGGNVSTTVTKATTHLVSTEDEVEKQTAKVNTAIKNGTPIVSIEFVNDLLSGDASGDNEENYLIYTDEKPAAKKAAPAKATVKTSAAKPKVPAKKNKEPEPESEEDEEMEEKSEEEEPKPKAAASKKRAAPDSGFGETGGPLKRIKLDEVKGKGAKVKSFKAGAAGEPSFPSDFEIYDSVTLQVTDFQSNHNKYYALELHTAKVGKKETYRLYTHYGRTDDLHTNPDAGQKETRYYDILNDAVAGFVTIYKDKTSAKKGYKPIQLATTKIGSDKAKATHGRGEKPTPSGKKPAAKKETKKVASGKSKLSPEIQELVKYIYEEATNSLTTKVSVEITEDGIVTPLGTLTLDQVEKGEEVLQKIYPLLSKKGKDKELEQLSGEFYTIIPHRIGRTKDAIRSAIIKTQAMYKEKEELLQLMRDMVTVNSGEQGNVLFEQDIDAKYDALNNKIELLDKKSAEYKELLQFLIETAEPQDFVNNKNMDEDERKERLQNIKEMTLEDLENYYNLVNIYTVNRAEERKAFAKKIGNEKLLYHGSRISNWVGLLSRGILMPQAVTAMGIPRTDFGWLGKGIYFGDCFETSGQYCEPGAKDTGFFLLARVALGKVYDQTEQDGKIEAPPKGYDSIHGNPHDDETEFQDDEFAIYKQNQQYMQYLVEFEPM